MFLVCRPVLCFCSFDKILIARIHRCLVGVIKQVSRSTFFLISSFDSYDCVYIQSCMQEQSEYLTCLLPLTCTTVSHSERMISCLYHFFYDQDCFFTLPWSFIIIVLYLLRVVSIIIILILFLKLNWFVYIYFLIHLSFYLSYFPEFYLSYFSECEITMGRTSGVIIFFYHTWRTWNLKIANYIK